MYKMIFKIIGPNIKEIATWYIGSFYLQKKLQQGKGGSVILQDGTEPEVSTPQGRIPSKNDRVIIIAVAAVPFERACGRNYHFPNLRPAIPSPPVVLAQGVCPW